MLTYDLGSLIDWIINKRERLVPHAPKYDTALVLFSYEVQYKGASRWQNLGRLLEAVLSTRG